MSAPLEQPAIIPAGNPGLPASCGLPIAPGSTNVQ